MHERTTRLRRLALALAIPAVAVGAIALTAHSASSSPAEPGLATDQPNQNQQTGAPNQQQSAPQQLQKSLLTKVSQSAKVTKTVTKTPTKTATPTKTPTKTASGSASAGPSGGASGGGGGVPGAPGGGGAANACYKQSTQQPVTLQVGQVGGKEALTDGNGCAVYLNNQDTQQSSACDSTCVATWPPIKGPGQAGTGVDQTNLSTFNRDDGTQQVTYFGHQLYYFTGDQSPGQANGQGNNGTWWLIDKTGNPITS